MESKPDLKRTLTAISKQGIESILKRLEPGYADGYTPQPTAKAKGPAGERGA